MSHENKPYTDESDDLMIEYNEDTQSKLPALQLLINMGYNYLTPTEALALRNKRSTQVILEGILLPWMRENNRFSYNKETHLFSENNLIDAIRELREVKEDGLIKTNEKIYDLLCLSKSYKQSVAGDIKSFSPRYIDWEHPEKNVYHVTEEFVVERSGSRKTRRPDIVLFVNGIPFCVMECKSPSIKNPIHQAIAQQIRNWQDSEIPKLFYYAQIVFALAANDALYAVTGTTEKFWALWREDGIEEELSRLRNSPLESEIIEKIFSSRNYFTNDGLVKNKEETRMITQQDRLLYSLCQPARMLELVYRYVLYDGLTKKIARYQQYFCVKKTEKRIQARNSQGKRQGGVVWHTQGSGKSLTMVFLAKAISLNPEIQNYKILIVTDRIDLDKQIYTTFQQCGKELTQAKSGKHLAKILQMDRMQIITTVIDKFEAAVSRHQVRIDNPNIFVLVDESHRSQYGQTHADMRRVLPNACYIGFTGTPIMKKDRDTLERFGGLIDSYTITQAVEDRAVVPLLYEGRFVDQNVEEKEIDKWFEAITAPLTQSQKADLKRKYSQGKHLNKTEKKVRTIAFDISIHFSHNWQNTPYKAQLVTQDKETALLYRKFLNELAMVSCEVLVSPPGQTEGEGNDREDDNPGIQSFWKEMMQKYGKEKEYNHQIIRSFKKSDHPEIIIVVDKLLTGFDAPRNTILYLTRNLKDHTLLQAIARVNRLHDGKDYGFILDYSGVLENLSSALDLYSALPEFNACDLEGTLTDIREQIATLPQKHTVLWDTFKEVGNKKDPEEYEVKLADDALRSKFYHRLSIYSRALAIALSSLQFLEETPANKIQKYKQDLKFFSKLKASVRHRYAEAVEFSEYEPKIRKLLDRHVGTGEVEIFTPLVNIFQKEAFEMEVAKIQSQAAKADTIAHRTARSIEEHMKEDPAFYKKFSEMLKTTISDYRQQRIKDSEYLEKATTIMNSVLNRTGDKIPQQLNNHDIAKAYFGILNDILPAKDGTKEIKEDLLVQIALGIDHIIEKNRIVNWVNDIDVQNEMRNQIDDLIFDLKEINGIQINVREIDDIMEQCIAVAKYRRP